MFYNFHGLKLPIVLYLCNYFKQYNPAVVNKLESKNNGKSGKNIK